MATRTRLRAADVVPERKFQETVIEMARSLRWRVHAERPAFSKGKWSTPIQGDPGFPDLVLARDGVLLIFELKAERGRLRADQKAWLEALQQDEDGTVLRPSDMPRIRELLT